MDTEPCQRKCHLHTATRFLGSPTPIQYMVKMLRPHQQPATITITIDPNLPVTFGDVNATVASGSLQVSWSTLTEINNSYFEVEASKDGNTFTKIGK